MDTMGRKALLRDLEAANFCRGKDGISLVERGKVDGEILFVFSHKDLASPIQVKALSNDVANYPKSGFMLFANPVELATWAIPALYDASQASGGISILQIIQDLSKRLVDIIEAHVVAGNPKHSSPDDQSIIHQVRTLSIASTPLQRLELHLNAARTAGLFAGYLGTDAVKEDTIFYTSVPISYLNISPDMLHYWNFESSDYVVLMMKFPNGYPSLAEYCMFDTKANARVQFRIGKCASRSPSLASAAVAFSLSNTDPNSDSHSQGSQKDSFNMMHLFYSIGKQLTTALPQLICLRRDKNVSWDQAHSILSDMSDGRAGVSGNDQPATKPGPSYFTDESGLSSTLKDDLVAAHGDAFNLPLVAMEFALHRFARCNDFCIVCHARIKNGYESAKPYVCSKNYCQLQLIECGFGYDLEHEITQHPYVVDLLLSFCLSSVRYGATSVAQMPQGLRLKVPAFGLRNDQAVLPSDTAELTVKTKELSVNLDKTSHSSYVRPGMSLMAISLSAFHSTSSGEYLWRQNGFDSYICTVSELLRSDASGKRTFRCKLAQIGHSQGQDDNDDGRNHGPRRVALYQFDQDVAKMPPCTWSFAIIFLGRLIPSVLDMRDFLKQQNRPLTEWHRLHPSSLSLLKWIVSSNRSFIVQDQEVPQASTAGDHTVASSKTVFGPRVQGITKEWMQFRFIQGSPQKEAEFRAAIESEKFKAAGQRQPSLFAWHGSPFCNWHGIIRTGLNFNKVSHGRASGDGIYLSNQLGTSIKYALAQDQNGQRMSDIWHNSELRPVRALSICEAVNWPERFVSQNPHYVVNKTQWVQCRYLLVEVRPTPRAIRSPLPDRALRQCTSYIQQDPSRLIHGMQGPIQIPRIDPPQAEVPKVAVAKKPAPKMHLKRPPLAELISSRPEKLGRSLYTKLTPLTTKILRVTPFTPGSLNWKGLAKMPAPKWAASSPKALSRLNRDVKSLQDVQAKTPLGELGWHVNFSELENVFQWVVELHSFPVELPLAQDMRNMGCESIVLEMRFGGSYPNSPPFVRVVQPVFVSFADGGGGHVTLGGAICSELLTSTGWKKDLSLEQVILNVRLGLCDKGRPARLAKHPGSSRNHYAIKDAVEAFQRACRTHGWAVPQDLQQILKN